MSKARRRRKLFRLQRFYDGTGDVQPGPAWDRRFFRVQLDNRRNLKAPHCRVPYLRRLYLPGLGLDGQ